MVSRLVGLQSPCVSRPHPQLTGCLGPWAAPAPPRTFPCPALGCWCAAVWRAQTGQKRRCTEHHGETAAGCCACSGPPSRTLAQVTLGGR